MNQLQDKLKHYLGTGLKYQIWISENDNSIRFLTPNDLNSVISYESHKPIMFRLDAITRPIKVEGYNDGKEFVPQKHIISDEAYLPDYALLEWYMKSMIHFPLWILEKLISWHFWIGDQSLFETGEILDKEVVQ